MQYACVFFKRTATTSPLLAATVDGGYSIITPALPPMKQAVEKHARYLLQWNLVLTSSSLDTPDATFPNVTSLIQRNYFAEQCVHHCKNAFGELFQSQP